MTTLKDIALDYTPKQTLNVTDLERVDLSWPIEMRTGTDKNGKEFFFNVIIANKQEFRVPNSVLEEIRTILELKPDAQFVKVTKTGSGLNTRYTVKVTK